jgi:hypothetical protein
LNAAQPFAALMPLPKIIFAHCIGLRTPAFALRSAYRYEHYT